MNPPSTKSAASQYAPDEYERRSYYNGISMNPPELLYRSDFLTTPFSKPTDRDAYIPVKSARGVFDTPLNSVWSTVGRQILDLLKAREIRWSSINPVRFFIHEQPEEEAQGSLGPVVVWIGVVPSSTSSDMAHEASQDILALLLENGVNDVVVEWIESTVNVERL